MANINELGGKGMQLPQLLEENDTLGRAYRAYERGKDKGAFLNSIVAALAELGSEPPVALAHKAQIESWAEGNGILTREDVLQLRADLDKKRAEKQAVSDERAKTARDLGMGQR